MRQDEKWQDFRDAAIARLQDAEELIQMPSIRPNEHGALTRHSNGAKYLAGYGVECIFKAYLLTNNKCSTLPDVIEKLRRQGKQPKDITGRDGHNLSHLYILTDLEQKLPPALVKEIGKCFKWRSTWRYNDRTAEKIDPVEFVNSVRTIVNYVVSLVP